MFNYYSLNLVPHFGQYSKSSVVENPQFLQVSSSSRFVRVAFTKVNAISGESEEESVSEFFHILGSDVYKRQVLGSPANIWVPLRCHPLFGDVNQRKGGKRNNLSQTCKHELAETVFNSISYS